jgi:hypothetical protein
MTRPEGSHEILPLLGAILLFWILEASAKATGRFYCLYTLDQADRLFSVEDLDLFNHLVKNYRFLSDAKVSPLKDLWTTNGGIHRFWQGFAHAEAAVFYFLPFLILTGLYYGPSKCVWFTLLVVFVVFLSGVLVTLAINEEFERRFKDAARTRPARQTRTASRLADT